MVVGIAAVFSARKTLTGRSFLLIGLGLVVIALAHLIDTILLSEFYSTTRINLGSLISTRAASTYDRLIVLFGLMLMAAGFMRSIKKVDSSSV